MLPGCCHFHISANSVPYLKPQKTEGRIEVLTWLELDFYKEEKGKKQSRKRSVKSRVALLTSGTSNLQLERWCREFDSQIARPTEYHPQIVQRGLSARRTRWVFFLFPPSHLPGVPGMLPGCCHFHISATGMAVLEANFRRNPLSCLNELRLTSSLNEAQDYLP